MIQPILEVNSPFVSVHLICYSQEKFIANAIESIISQKVNFAYELIIGDDCSTDSTADIIKQYYKQYPQIIKPLFHSHNLGPKGLAGKNNFLSTYKSCTGKYIALCDGDDYWTDDYKLQKQVDFLENNSEYSLCFSNYTVQNDFKNVINNRDLKQSSFDIEYVIKSNPFAAATSLFERKYFNPDLEWFKKMAFGDWSIYINILFLSKKKAYCLPDVTAVYRIHSGGVHGNLHASNKTLIDAYKLHIDFYKKIAQYLFKGEYAALIKEGIKERNRIISDLKTKELKRKIAAIYHRLIK